MSSGTGSPGLADLLELLKQRSGRSYTALAHRTGLSRSTLHRYCLGTTVPRTFGAVEKVARVCGADREELDRLYRAWCQALDAESGDAASAEGESGDAASAEGADEGEGAPGGESGARGQRPDGGGQEGPVEGPVGEPPEEAETETEAGVRAAARSREQAAATAEGAGHTEAPSAAPSAAADASAPAATPAPTQTDTPESPSALAPSAPAPSRVASPSPSGSPSPSPASSSPDVPPAEHPPPATGHRRSLVGRSRSRFRLRSRLRLLAPLWSHGWLRVAALLLALAIPATVLSVSYGGSGEAGGTRGGVPTDARAGGGVGRQDVKGPEWTIAPQRVPDAFYGINLSSDTGEMPGPGSGSVRLWHSGTRWSQIEPERGEYEWKTLDRLVDAAERRDLPVLFTLGGTPPWAAPDGGRGVFADARSAPPDDLADWDRFVKALASRYKGRIEAYELWDYPSDRGAYSGSLATLAEMVERASQIIGEADPQAQSLCPSFGSLWHKSGRERLRKFIRTGAYEHCDAAALKLPPRRADGRPEEMVTLVKKVQRLFYREGKGRTELWNTGPDSDVAVREHLDARRARDYAPRFYLTGLYAKDQALRRTYFYSWGSPEVPLVIELAGGQLTEAGKRVERLRQWLKDASVTSCGSGAAMGLADGAYTCSFERKGRELLVYWTTRGRAHVRLGEHARLVRGMGGSEKRAEPGALLRFGEEPVLVEHRPRKE